VPVGSFCYITMMVILIANTPSVIALTRSDHSLDSLQRR
jgi:hypothetical protein